MGIRVFYKMYKGIGNLNIGLEKRIRMWYTYKNE